MNKKIKCLICNKEITNNNSYIGSHVKRIHGLLLKEYIFKYYKNVNPRFKIVSCGFCEKNAIPEIIANHINYTYEKKYTKGYSCKSNECRNNISLLIFNTNYNKKTYEHIGSNVKYISLLHKKTEDEVKYKKSKGIRSMDWTTSLEGFIKKFGKEEGTKKYYARNKKISKANTRSWFIEKYGEKKGNEKYELFRKKKHKAFGPSKSIKSKKINNILDKNQINYIEEYKYENEKGKNGSIDFYLTDYNIAIEFYGDYWHCNPNYYNSNYFHRIMKKFSYEIWEKDKKRIKHIFETEYNKNITILIIWESSNFSEEYLIELLEEIKNKNTIIEI